MNTSFDDLMALARQHRPESQPRPGFDTRLGARIRDLRATGESEAFFPLFCDWLWRASWSLTPITALLALFFALHYGIALPDGAGALVTHLTHFLPGAEF